MYFKTLPEHVKQGIIYLNSEELFRERFRHDSVLDELDEEKLDLDVCNSHLRQIFKGEYEADGVKLKPMTLAVWSWLWTTSSPFVRLSDSVTIDDIDYFFYLLEHGVQEDIDVDYEGYCLKHGWTPEQACEMVATIVKDAFYPLKMLPGTGKVTVGKSEIIYDLAWLVSVVSAVHRTCGALQDDILHKMPMMLALHYYVQAGIDSGMKGVGRRSSEELLKAYDKRCCELVCERLIELNIIKEEEKETYIQQMMDVNNNESE